MVLQCCCWAWRVQHGAAVKAAAKETRHFCYVLTWAKLFRCVGLTNRSPGRLSARDNKYTSSAILTCTRPKFIASSTIPLFDISSASHNYDTSSSIHKFDITRHTTYSISIWVSEYKCILKNSYDLGVYGDRRRRCLFGHEGSTLGVNPTSVRSHWRYTQQYC